MSLIQLNQPILGNHGAKKAYLVIIVDRDDAEDTKSAFYRAADEDELFDLVKDDVVGDPDESDKSEYEYLSKEFDYDWGTYIIHKEIGVAKD